MTYPIRSTRHTGPSRYRAMLNGLAGALLVIGSGAPALADDTEILIGEIGDYEAPNILIAIDTSGSMAGEVLVNDNYDPAIDYPGTYNDDSRLYYTLTDAQGNIVYPDADYAMFGAYVNRTALACAAAGSSLATTGRYVDRTAQFDPQTGAWATLQTENPNPLLSGVDRFTECFADDGSHGLVDGGAEVYPVNGVLEAGAIAWTADPDDPERFDWSVYRDRYAFFEGNFLNWIQAQNDDGAPVVRTRLEIVQQVTTDLINDLTAPDVGPLQDYNVGLMRFSTTGDGGMVLQPVRSVSSSRDELITSIDGLTSSNNTPLAETMFEAYQYYRGGPVTYGLLSLPQLSDEDSYTGANYNGPITASCQKNYVVLLSDGLPTGDSGADDAIAAVTGAPCTESCLDDLSMHMANADFAPAIDDVQSVETFVIGFFTDADLLRNTATAQIENDDGSVSDGYFLASNVDELRGAFDSILDGVSSSVATFTAPAVSVNGLNRLVNRDVLYFTMFRPASNGEPHWDGNLKAYFIGRPAGADPNVDNAELAILDDNRLPAIDENGNFRTGARSIWSANADGGVVTSGGFVSRLGTNRRVVTSVAGPALFAMDNEVSDSNTLITAQDLGLTIPPDPDGAAAAQARRLELLRFASGLDEDGNPVGVIGDPLHTQPLIISYGNDSEDIRLFFTTNDGYLHAIDPTPANVSEDLEEFAFIPKELLQNLDIIERNPPALPDATQKMYGLDGPLTAYIEGDTNFVVDPGERLYVYSAMRRGGTSYYALDMGTSRNSDPNLAFQIDRGDTGFEKLGQTWSAAVPATVNLGGTETEVLIFGGGYDTSHDANYTSNEGTGNAIYMVNAKTGALLWSASSSGATLNLPDMVYSIPSDVTVLDINQDGLSDRLYVGDMGGQVWRFDMAEDGITGTRLATLAGPDVAGERRFFNAPRVARILGNGQNFLAIAIGTGWRSHPKATENQDRFYILKDVNVFAPQVDGTTGEPIYADALTNDDLVAIDLGNPADAGQLSGAGGWYLDLPNSGEKNLSSAVLADNRVFFTTYAPTGSAPSCVPTPVTGVGRLYGLDILTGLPSLLNTDSTEDGFIVLDAAGIPPTPQSVFVEPACDMNCDDPDPDDPDPPLPVTSTNNGTCRGVSDHTLVVGTQQISVGVCTEPRRTYWSDTNQPLEEL